LKVGIFHPGLNVCGGGEWVALSIINTLKENGDKVIILTDEKVDQNKYIKTFGQKLNFDEQMVFPFHFFRRGDAHNIYTDALSCLVLKSKCDLIIDTYTRMILPTVDVTYIHYPIFTRSLYRSKLSKIKNGLYFLPYHAYEARMRLNSNKILFANSNFTATAIKSYLGVHSQILYPSFSPFFLADEKTIRNTKRLDQVVTVSRYAPEKNLEIIPQIAKQIKNTKFLIIGNLHYKDVYSRLLKLINHLDVADNVILMTNVPKYQLRDILLQSKVYLHCAVKEHFGISIVEAIASGCLAVAHDSGGPQEIVSKEFRYETLDESVEIIRKAIEQWSVETAWKMRNSMLKFSQESFSKELLRVLKANGCLT
jgi:glycosyltransferase involved in cell wall biosynthesis